MELSKNSQECVRANTILSDFKMTYDKENIQNNATMDADTQHNDVENVGTEADEEATLRTQDLHDLTATQNTHDPVSEYLNYI